MADDVTEIAVGPYTLRFFTPNKMTTFRANTILTKEPATIAWIREFSPRAMFWDVGANVGVYTLYAAIVAGVRVLAFEPGAANYHVLNRNIQLNGLQDVVSALCVCLSDAQAVGKFHMRSAEAGEALHNFGSPVDYKGTEFKADFEQGAVALRADDLVDSGAPPPNYMKIDVDGLEKAVLNGAAKIVSSLDFHSLLVEVNLDDKEEVSLVRAFAAERGLIEDATILENRPREIGGIRIYNMIFRRAS